MISEQSISALRDQVSGVLSENRFKHVMGVENAAIKIGKYCLPERILELRAAALLHDITKEIKVEEHLEILQRNSFVPTDDIIANPHLLHSFSAPFMILDKYPDFALPEILSAVEKHTLGAADMTVFDEIIFISDYIEEGRIYEPCIATRKYLYDSFVSSNYATNQIALHKACILSIDLTIKSLEDKKRFVHPRVFEAKQAIISLLAD